MKALLILSMLSFSVCLAAQKNYHIVENVLGTGQTWAQNDNYTIKGTLGQTMIGRTIKSADFEIRLGFWEIARLFTAINELEVVNQNFINLGQNYPNPCIDHTTIPVFADRVCKTSINLINATGQKLYEIYKGELNYGEHTFKVQTRNLQPGIYFYTLETKGTFLIRKLIKTD